jgi:hypothetical protein
MTRRTLQRARQVPESALFSEKKRMAKKMAKKPMASSNGRKPVAKAPSTPKPPKISPASKPRSKGEIYRVLSEQTGLGRKQVVQIFDSLGQILAADLGKGAGVVNVAGLMKVTAIRKPAQPARKGVPNPFKPGELMDVAAKPARTVVKVRPLKSLKSMV